MSQFSCGFLDGACFVGMIWLALCIPGAICRAVERAVRENK